MAEYIFTFELLKTVFKTEYHGDKCDVIRVEFMIDANVHSNFTAFYLTFKRHERWVTGCPAKHNSCYLEECLLPTTVLDLKDFLQFISVKNCLTHIYFAVKSPQKIKI